MTIRCHYVTNPLSNYSLISNGQLDLSYRVGDPQYVQSTNKHPKKRYVDFEVLRRDLLASKNRKCENFAQVLHISGMFCTVAILQVSSPSFLHPQGVDVRVLCWF